MAPKEDAKAAERGGCSARTERLLKPALSYIGQLVKAMQDGIWDPEKRKEGWIPLVVAENKLGTQLVLDRLQSVSGYPTAVMNYSGMKGTPECLAAMARLLERHLVKGHSVDPAQLVIGSGCSALLDNLFWCICDEGDGVLIPAPYYPAFDNDLQAKCGVQPLPFFLTEGEPGAEGAAAIRAQLDAATVAAAARGVAVRGLLVTNPNNPLGTIYREDSVREMLRWCLDNRMHYISDEIYALSVFKPEEARFTSAITLAQELVPPPLQPPQPQRSRLAALFSRPKGAAAAAASSISSTDESESDSDDEAEVREKKRAARVARREARAAVAEAAKRRAEEAAAAAAAAGASAEAAAASDGTALYSQELVDTYVHLMYGLSKDWCASGLRLGVLYTRNRRLHQSLDPISVFAGVSNFAQWAVAQALDDADWAAAFLRDNARLLEASYDVLAAALKEEKIPFVPAVAGMFVWIDLRKWLPEPKTWEAERTLWQRVCDECKVILTPGRDCHAAEPGHFRLCFAWVPPAALKEAVRRLRSRVLEDEDGGDCSLQ